MPDTERVTSGLHRLLPVLDWLPGYRRACLYPDLMAGVALWAVMVPEGMAYAGIVGVPPIMGLYTLVPPLIVYALLGTSRLLVVGPDTATGLISALTVGAVVARGTPEFAAVTSALAILIGMVFLAFGALRMGWVAAFIPAPVMRGFIEGLVWVTIIGQVPQMLGIAGTTGTFIEKAGYILARLQDASPGSVLTGVLSLAALLLLRGRAPRVPAALAVALLATVAVSLIGADALGVGVVGDLPHGLPHFAMPAVDPALVVHLLPGALAIVLVGYAEALGGAKAVSGQGGGDIDPDQELVAHGPANILSGLFGGFLVVGSLSKTSVALLAGARSQVANLFAAALCLGTLVFLTPLFHDMPDPALGAIVIAAMLHLSKPAYLRQLMLRSRPEFALALAVFAGELALGVLQGIALGVVVALTMLVYRTTHPKNAVLGQLPGTEAYRNVRRHPEARTYPGLMIWRPEGDLFFASSARLMRDLKAFLAASQPPVRQILLDAEAINFIDVTGCDELVRTIGELRERGIGFGIARARDPVLEQMRLGGVDRFVGPEDFHERLTDGVRAWKRSQGA